jgi:ribosomal protein S18 acetylase RimI-like enzyme
MLTAITTTTEQNRNRCLDTLLLAFSGDPGIRWLYPDSTQYLRNFRNFAAAFGGAAFEHHTAFCTEDLHAAALWLPPGVQPDEEQLVSIIQQTVSSDRQEEVFSVLEQMGSYHPQEPHWHLPLIGTDPNYQGQGYGSRLLAHTLAILDREHKLAYLEATSSRSVSLYLRHGFEILGTIQVSTSPPIVPMLRKPH